MKKNRRFLRKALRPRFILIYLLVIVIGIVAITYAFGGIKATANTISNKDFNYDEFETITDNEEIKIAQNDTYALYFNPASTIATIYLLNEDAMKGTTGSDGYEEFDKSKCTYYSTAKTELDEDGNIIFSDESANLIVHYATGSSISSNYSPVNSANSSVNYDNPYTNLIEQHYKINYIEDGVQVLYEMGQFTNGVEYFPLNYYKTMYKPFEEAYYSRNEFDETKYNTDMQTWIQYMKFFGVEDPENASEQEILKAISGTFEERFRGNTLIVNSKSGSSPSGTVNYTYSAKKEMYVYTKAGYEYLKNLIDTGEIYGEYEEDVTTYKGEYCWHFSELDESFFTSYGTYFNCDNSPLTNNPFIISTIFNDTIKSYYGLITTIDDTHLFPYYKRSDTIITNRLMTAYNLFYFQGTFKNAYGDVFYFNGEELQTGGFAARDEDGNFLYNEDGTPVASYYDSDVLDADNALFNIDVERDLALFQVVLEFKLTEEGLETTLLQEGLVDSSNASGSSIEVDDFGNTISDINKSYIFAYIDVLPYMTYVNNTGKTGADVETGQIVVPDGSGAIINFNSTKINATAINTTYYGTDKAFTSKKITEESESLLLGMFGFIHTGVEQKAILGVIEKGGNQIGLYANTDEKISRAYFYANIRKSTTVYIGAGTNKKDYIKWSDDICESDLQFKYSLLGEDENDYVSLAEEYRDYLIARDGLTEKDTTDKTVVDLNFLGSFEKYTLFLGFKYKTPASLTTFSQAQEIIEELSNGVTVGNTVNKVSNFNVSYTSWTNEEMEYEVGGNLGVSSVLGGKKGMQNLISYLSDKNINLYAENFITTTKGYDLSYGDIKYTARDAANTNAVVYKFDAATERIDKTINPTYIIRPNYYEAITDSLITKINKLKLTSKASSDTQLGYYLVDLGNLSAGTYGNGEEIYGEGAVQYQLRCLEKISENNLVKISAPFDYAIKYADVITEVPMASTAYGIYDETIPFYQLVISGLVDYTCEEINGTSSKSADWFFAKALETGSNLSFVISAENPTVLLDTDYTYYYQSYYNNWKEKIATMASTMDAIGIAQGRLTYHKNVGKNIANVKYTLADNSIIELYINTTGKDYTYNSIVIPAYGYKVV